jgi:hypothetical protein
MDNFSFWASALRKTDTSKHNKRGIKEGKNIVHNIWNTVDPKFVQFDNKLKDVCTHAEYIFLPSLISTNNCSQAAVFSATDIFFISSLALSSFNSSEASKILMIPAVSRSHYNVNFI